MFKWAGITFACGMVLVVIETVMAARKKGGITPTDKQRIRGIVWVTIVLSAIAAGLYALWPE